MRLLAVLVGVAGIGIAAPSSVTAEPAFLGIGLDPTSNNGCRVTEITQNSAAQLAGFAFGDLVVGFAGAGITDCKALLSEIANRAPGDDVLVDVMRITAKRDVERTPIGVTLTSRADVTRRRMLGRKLMLPVIGLEDGYALDTATFDRTTFVIVAGSSCVDCAYVTSTIAHRLRNRLDLALLAVLPYAGGVAPQKDARYEAPIAVTEPRFIKEILVDDARAHVMIVDREGTVIQIQAVSTEQSLREFVDGLIDEAEQTERTWRR